MSAAGDSAGRPAVGRVKPSLSADERLLRWTMAVVGLFLVLCLLLPIAALLSKGFQDRQGNFVGLSNFQRYADTPALSGSIANSIVVSVLATVISVGLAFVFAFGLNRTCMRAKGACRLAAQLPLLAPSLLPGIALIYLFGNQGMLKGLLFGETIYGPIGIVLGAVFWTFPHALVILTTALALSDARLYEAAASLRARRARVFLTVTLPAAKYGLVSALFVVFTLVITDFGVPKVVGGHYNVLATDIYKQVVGQQNFEMGAVVGLVLLLPAVLAFAVDRLAARKQVALLSARAVPYAPKPNAPVDLMFTLLCGTIACLVLAVLGVALFASLVKFWPYDLSLSLQSYDFDEMDGGGWRAYGNSVRLSLLTAFLGTVVVFTGAYVVEKSRGLKQARGLVQFVCILPLAVPGLVLGLGYIFFFNHPANPLHFLYGGMTILVLCTVVHFYTVPHLTALTALKQLDPEFEAVSASLKVPLYRTFLRVTVPVCLPALLDIWGYYFVNAMTTVSAVVFLYSVNTTLASVAVLNMDDAGTVGPAAAMAMMIVFTSAAVRLVQGLATRGLERRIQAWRKR